MNWGKRHDAVIHVTLLVMLLLLAYLSIFIAYVPNQPWDAGSFRMFFYHIPIAWTAYLSFGIVFAASIVFLKTRNQKWDMVASSSAEVGVLLTTLALLTGSLWMKAQQGDFWRWEDAKLFTTFILWMAYVAYIALRVGIKGEAKARLSAVFGMISFVFVPLSFFASRVMTSLHTNLTSYPFPRENVAILILGVVAFTFLFISLLRLRIGVEKLSAQLEIVKEGMEESI